MAQLIPSLFLLQLVIFVASPALTRRVAFVIQHIRHRHADHRLGHVQILLHDESGRALLIVHWGSTGRADRGQVRSRHTSPLSGKAPPPPQPTWARPTSLAVPCSDHTAVNTPGQNPLCVKPLSRPHTRHTYNTPEGSKPGWRHGWRESPSRGWSREVHNPSRHQQRGSREKHPPWWAA